MIGAIIGFIGFLLALPLDALAMKIKQDRLKRNKKGLSSRLNVAKGKEDKAKKEKPKLLSKPNTKTAEDDVREKLGKKEHKPVILDKADKKKQELIDKAKEASFKSLATLIRNIFKGIGLFVEIIVNLMGIFLIIAIIVACIIGYIYSYMALYSQQQQQQKASTIENSNGSVRNYKQESDEEQYGRETTNSSIWGSFESFDDYEAEEDNGYDLGDEIKEHEDKKGVLKDPIPIPGAPTSPSKPKPTPSDPEPTPTEPTPTPDTPTVKPENPSHYEGVGLHIPSVSKVGQPPTAGWKRVEYNNGKVHYYMTQNKGNLIAQGGWQNQFSRSCMLIAMSAVINTQTSSWLSLDDINTAYKNRTGDDFTYVGNGGGTGYKICQDMYNAVFDLHDENEIRVLVPDYPAGNQAKFEEIVDTSLANGNPVLYHCSGEQTKGMLSSGGEHWMAIVGKTPTGNYEILTNNADDTTRICSPGVRSAYAPAEILHKYGNRLYCIEIYKE